MKHMRMSVAQPNGNNHGRSLPLILLLFSILPAILIASCTSKRTRNGPGDNRKKLTVALNSGVEGNALRIALRSYEDDSSHNISITIHEAQYAKLYQDEAEDLKAGKGEYDLIMLDDPWFPSFAGKGYLVQIGVAAGSGERGASGPAEQGLHLDDFVEASLNLCRYPYKGPQSKGPLYALPYVGNSQLFSYRKDLFDKYQLQPPSTWDEVLKAARKIQTTNEAEPCSPGNPKTGTFGYVMRARAGNEVVTDFLPILWAYGGDIYDETGRQPIINNAAAIKALTLMTELGKCSPPNYWTMDAEDLNAYLIRGMAAQAVNWPAFSSSYHDDGKWRETTSVTFSVLPSEGGAGVAVIGNWLLAIPQNSKNREEARKLLVWLTEPKQMSEATLLRGNPPTRKSIFSDPLVKQVNPEFNALFESLNKSRARSTTPLWPCIETTLGKYLHLANREDSSRLTVEDALNKTRDDLLKNFPQGLETKVEDISGPNCSQGQQK